MLAPPCKRVTLWHWWLARLVVLRDVVVTEAEVSVPECFDLSCRQVCRSVDDWHGVPIEVSFSHVVSSMKKIA